MRLLCCLILLASSLPGHAAQSRQQILDTVSEFIAQQTAALPGSASVKINPIDRRLKLQPCEQLEAFLPNGAQLVGRVSVGVRCIKGANWQIYVPSMVILKQQIVISARPLTRNQQLTENDIALQTMELTRASGFTDPDQVIGMVARYNITQGQLIRKDMLRAPYAVEQGQKVPIIIQGSGFSIRSEGVALKNASVGQSVRARVQKSKVISGTASADGTILMKP